jgi:type 1 fimbria pilin
LVFASRLVITYFSKPPIPDIRYSGELVAGSHRITTNSKVRIQESLLKKKNKEVRIQEMLMDVFKEGYYEMRDI